MNKHNFEKNLKLGLAWLGLAWLHETVIYIYHNKNYTTLKKYVKHYNKKKLRKNIKNMMIL